MRLEDIRVGQRVISNGEISGHERDFDGFTGTVRFIRPELHRAERFGVEFDSPEVEGHRLNEEIASTRGLWCSHEILTLEEQPAPREPVFVTNPVVGRRYRIVDIGPGDSYYSTRARWIGLTGTFVESCNAPSSNGEWIGPYLRMVNPGHSVETRTPFAQVKLAEAIEEPAVPISNPLYRELLTVDEEGGGLQPPPDHWQTMTLGVLARDILELDEAMYVTPQEYDALDAAIRAIQQRLIHSHTELKSFLSEVSGGEF